MPLTIDSTTHRSPNSSPRPAGVVPDMVILHDGEGTKASDLRELLRTDVPLEDRVSAHYYVDRRGNVYELVNPLREAWHAGTSSWQGRGSLEIRRRSIGIESEHKQGQNWPAVQRQAYADLCRYLIGRFPIQQRYVAAHRWIAPNRKFDPTDWPDDELRTWIAALFVAPQPDWEALWGPIASPDQTSWNWDIPKLWKAHYARLGKCLAPALYGDGVVVQLFEGGDVRGRDADTMPVYEVCFR